MACNVYLLLSVFFGELLESCETNPGIQDENQEQEIEVDDNENELEEDEDEDEEIEQDLYTKNKWFLQKGGLVKSLDGFNIDNLPASLKINLKRAVCRVEILRGDSNTTMKYELFKRLNSGGSKLTPQEIRNAIHRGTDTRLNNILLEISQNNSFKALTSLTQTKKNELYDQELVLRFFAFYNNANEIKDNMQNFLNKFMENTVNNSDFDYEDYKNKLIKVLDLVHSLNDANVFRTEKSLFVPAWFEGILIGVAQNYCKYENNLSLLQEKISLLKQDTLFKKYSGTASNSSSRIKNRLTRVQDIFK
jgi:hypothetical protein